MPKSPPLAAAFLLTFASLSGAETTELSVTRDTSLFELDPTFNLGTQRDLPAGTLGEMGENLRSRILFQVDLTLPDKTEIIAARYRVKVTMAPPSETRANSTFALHRFLTPWAEGEQRGDLPGGRRATDGESTWAANSHPDALWATAGGEAGTDYATEPSATARVSGTGEVIFQFNSVGLADLRSMLTKPAANHGWILLTQDEDVSKTARRFAASEHRTTPPILEIEHEGSSPNEPEPFIASLEQDLDTREWIITAPATQGQVYTLQCSSSLELNDWKNQVNKGEILAGVVRFRKMMNESRQFVRIIASR
ncbi:MAG: hypothetical protein L7V86_16055 [Verrucomicrobiales bacterium]|jgi:hypothetical protein|nr:hypothetical protein [Verrucomicrobiales bacterium]MDA7644320.1 hypothetical protein [Verrucomicrobiales bacterium]MDF1784662.1 hypothetical protein [Verrucomicrobiales bacterium]